MILKDISLYLAGPMSGYSHNNYPSFEYAARRLRQAGWKVISPHELEQNVTLKETRERIEISTRRPLTRGQLYALVIPGDIKALALCDGLVLLPGWQESDGTSLELHAAGLFELSVFTSQYPDSVSLEEWIDDILLTLDAEFGARLEADKC